MSPGRFGHGSRRAMERRNCGLPPAPCASQKQSSPPGPATSCHPSIHREVVRITDPGSSTMQDPATHTGPDGEDIPLSTLLQHCPPTPRPRHPASLYDLEGAPLALDLCQTPSGPALGQRKLCVRLRTPPSDLHAVKRSVRAKKKKTYIHTHVHTLS